MSFDTGIIVSLSLYCILREVFYIYSTQKLLNKLMSRNYNEFAYTESQAKAKKNQSSMLQDNYDVPEDFGILTGIN